MVFSLVASSCVVTLMWRRHNCPGAKAMITLVIATFVWTLGFLLEANSGTLERQLFYNNIGYIGSMTVPVAWFLFALDYSNDRNLITGWKTALLYLFPCAIVVLVWTNASHQLMWYDAHLGVTGSFTVTVKTYGPMFWVALAHNYLLILAGGIILLRRLFVGAPLYTRQAVALIVAVCLPWLWNIIYVFDLFALPRKDLTPVMFAVSAVALVLGLLRLRLFTTIPFARRFIIQQLNDGVFVFDMRNNLVEANPMALKMLAVDKSVIGNNVSDLASLSPVFRRLSSLEFGIFELPLTLSGETSYYELETAPMVDDRKQVGRLAILRDITFRKRTEEQYRLVADYTADVIYKFSVKDESFSYISPSAQRLFGYTEEEAFSLKLKDVVTLESYLKQRNQMLGAMQAGVLSDTLVLDAIHKDGHIFPVEVHATLVYDDNGEPSEIVGVARDITERSKMQEQLFMQDRLASIGQLTSGLTHELNNPLTSIISLSSLLLGEEISDDVKQDVKAINDEAHRIANTVNNLTTFTQAQSREKRPEDINGCIKKVLELREYEQKVNNIRVDAGFAPDLPKIMGSASELQQVFFNIVINAEYFMHETHGEGTLTVTTEKSGDSVRVSFSDDGPGISGDDMKKLFSPFFTTKKVGVGTGLSLSICLGIITGHGGRIWAESKLGKGSTFIIELPEYVESVEEEYAGNGS